MEIPPVWMAVQTNDLTLLKEVLTKENIEATASEEMYTPLMVAANHSYPDIVSHLIENGADVNAQSKSGMTALMLAMNPNSEHTQLCVTQLIDAKADLDIQSAGGSTALMEAAHKGMLRQVLTLIVAGASINKQNKYGETALMVACMKDGEPGVVGALLAAGSNKSLTDIDGLTAIDIAKRSESTEIYELLSQ
jgi:ankyrin repeat protein